MERVPPDLNHRFAAILRVAFVTCGVAPDGLFDGDLFETDVTAQEVL